MVCRQWIRRNFGVSALQGIRVIELANDVSAAYCAKQFAQWGADVVCAEPSGGTPLRTRHPAVGDSRGDLHSMAWTWLATNKRLIPLDGLSSLIDHADVLVTDSTAIDFEEAGMSFSDLRDRNPGLIIVMLSHFGSDGPYADFQGSELVVEALSGYLCLNGESDKSPLQSPGHITGYTIGVNSFVGALAALIKRQRTGQGDLVEICGMETLAMMVPSLKVQYSGKDTVREGGTVAGVRMFPSSDGFVCFIPIIERMKGIIGDVLEIPEDDWPRDQFEGSYADRVQKAVSFLPQYTLKKSTEEIFQAFEERGIVCGKVTSPSQLLMDPQLKARNFFHQFDHPKLGPLAMAGAAASLSGLQITEPAHAVPVAPAEISWARDGTAEAHISPDHTRPLEGLQLLDLTQAWIGPFAAMLLADLGAQTLKLESHKRPDVWRQTSPNPEALTNIDAALVNSSDNYNSVNRNKKNLCLDLKSDEGKELFHRLVAESDVVMENYTPKVMDNFGLGYDTLKSIRPDIVMTSFCGFGKTGPLAEFKTNGSAIETLAGWDYFHRYPGGDPVEMGFYQADPISGFHMAALTLLAVFHRNETGEGQAIDGSMLEASTSYIGDLILAAQVEGDDVQTGNINADAILNGVFPCAGEDCWISITLKDDSAWQALSGIDGAPVNLETIEADMAAWTASQDANDLMEALQAAGIAAGVVRGVEEGLTDPHLTARDWFNTMQHADLGTHKYNGFPWRFESTELKAHLPPPRLGEHSEELLRDRLGLSPDAIADLKEKDVTGSVMLKSEQRPPIQRF